MTLLRKIRCILFGHEAWHAASPPTPGGYRCTRCGEKGAA